MIKESIKRLVIANYLILDTRHYHTGEIDELLRDAYNKVNTAITALYAIEEETHEQTR